MYSKSNILLGLALSLGIAQIASAADMPAMYTKAPIVPLPYSWTGFYAGLNLGGSWGNQSNNLEHISGAIVQTNSAHLNGIIGGGQIGYNWQVRQWVLGLEADIQGSGQQGNGDPAYTITPGFNIQGNLDPGSTTTYTDKLNWFGTVRARLGWAMDRWLPYVTGGWAYGGGSISGTRTTLIPTTTTFSGSQFYSGWTLGAGLEWAFKDNWSAKAEYLYIDFGNGPTVSVSPILNIVGGKMTDNIFRLGVNYKF